MRHTSHGMCRLLIAAALLTWSGAARAEGAADLCAGGDALYEVRPGDTLSLIAERVYGEASRWSQIDAANPELGGGADIAVGMTLVLPCAGEAPRAAPAGDGAISLLGAGDFAPFTGRDLPGGGMLTEIALSALGAGAPDRAADIIWIEDRAAHLDPLLSGGLMDLGLGWTRPDCNADPGAAICADFLFSKPLFEMLMVLFVREGEAERFRGEPGGMVLCRPRGFGTHDLDRPDRRWIAEGRIVLRQPGSLAACFRHLLQGEVDAVAVDEFSGRAALREAGLAGQVSALTDRPLSIERLHLVAARGAPGAEGLIAAFDAGLDRIRTDGRYQQILDAHLGRFWGAGH
ncbi:LysM peptidoglycan-binding domain-containing protein [Roseovarius aquimarinus]|uniref:LysM peptidoglycan-binding domain-containing protein n=1 Tax=Roseovarius aquimarinus TaxID=1229156 RepID=A0ABW7I616_9RHOB